MDLDLRGKAALVAAASAGLGYGVARALAHEGARVSICSRKLDAVQGAAKRLADETGAEVMATTCDVTKAADIQSWVDQTAALGTARCAAGKRGRATDGRVHGTGRRAVAGGV